MIFIFQLPYMVDYVNRFSYSEPSLHLWYSILYTISGKMRWIQHKIIIQWNKNERSSSSNIAQEEHQVSQGHRAQTQWCWSWQFQSLQGYKLSFKEPKHYLHQSSGLSPRPDFPKSAPWQSHRSRLLLSFHQGLWESLGSDWISKIFIL